MVPGDYLSGQGNGVKSYMLGKYRKASFARSTFIARALAESLLLRPVLRYGLCGTQHEALRAY